MSIENKFIQVKFFRTLSNQWLFDRIGIEIFQWIQELVQNEIYRFQAYRLISSKLNLTNNFLSNEFNKAFEKSKKRMSVHSQ